MNKQHQIVIPELDNVAIRRNSDGMFSVFDLIRIVAGSKNPRQVWSDICRRFPEVVQKTDNFKFSGRGQRNTPVVDRGGWLYILGLLPGIVGQKYRESAARVVLLYMDADVTLAEDIVERTTDEEGLERLQARLKGKEIRNEHTHTLMKRGVKQGIQFAICTNKTYSGLYGTNAKGLRKRKGLKDKANVREYMTTDELIEVGFSENLSTRKIKNSTAQGCGECGAINYQTAKGVADFIRNTLAA